jgi:Rad3-related DNA helicase
MNSDNPKVRNNGAVFFGVARGKLSEGISLNDDASRCVMLIGIPYPNKKDPKIMMKQHYLTMRRWHPMDNNH